MASGRRLIVLGAGGHAKVVIEAALAATPDCAIALLDDDPGAVGRKVVGHDVLGGREWLAANWPAAAVISAVGRNQARAEAIAWLRSAGRPLASVVHPGAIVSPSAHIGLGCFVAAGAVISAEAILGDGVIVNTGATIDHDCDIGSVVHVAPGAHLCGGVRVGDFSLIGAGSTIIPGIAIGKEAIVGAGQVVISDTPDRCRTGSFPGPG